MDSCQFWGDEQIYRADEIRVKNDITGDPDNFAAHFINANMEEFGIELKDGREPGIWAA